MLSMRGPPRQVHLGRVARESMENGIMVSESVWYICPLPQSIALTATYIYLAPDSKVIMWTSSSGVQWTRPSGGGWPAARAGGRRRVG